MTGDDFVIPVDRHSGEQHRARAGNHVFATELGPDDVEKLQASGTDVVGLGNGVRHNGIVFSDKILRLDEVGVVQTVHGEKVLVGGTHNAHDLEPSVLRFIWLVIHRLPRRGLALVVARFVVQAGSVEPSGFGQGFGPKRALGDDRVRRQAILTQVPRADDQILPGMLGGAVPGKLPSAQVIALPGIGRHVSDLHVFGKRETNRLLRICRLDVLFLERLDEGIDFCLCRPIGVFLVIHGVPPIFSPMDSAISSVISVILTGD
ncbi:hypothetical protein DESC_40052 [Desulfosarcina cetonica]|nr:hypothetical protein DESC_40052 [Desulfosarcina cetonica]